MKVHPVIEEAMDLRRKNHILNAEKFIETRNIFHKLVNEVQSKITTETSKDLKEKSETLRRKGTYMAVRGQSNFVRYTCKLQEINTSLHHLLAEFSPNN
ncbi:unnamed protein product [Caenorhabditis sp. 36 PRJEB53466]|nr:unnamed protein product [Caenorhabditis sp. 36 PRJEB53466]